MKPHRGLSIVLLGMVIAQAVIIRSQSQQIDRYAEEVDDRPKAPALHCAYGGKMSTACADILSNTAEVLRRNQSLSVVMVGGDDETGEYLTDLGIEAERISEKPATDGTLTLEVR